MITAGIITELYIQKLDILETTAHHEELWQKAYSRRQNETMGNVSRVHYLFESLYIYVHFIFTVVSLELVKIAILGNHIK